MNFPRNRFASPCLLAVALCTLLLATSEPVIAAPGAHGPNGEHLESPPTMRSALTLPRIEAKSEAFELVAELRTTELAIVIDRFETNEPVLGAKLEVESGALKAVAVFRAEHGDYAITDAPILKALGGPGEHGLVFTLVADKDSDLLDGTLVNATGRAATTAAVNGHGPTHASNDHGYEQKLERTAWIGGVLVTMGLISCIVWWRRGRGNAIKSQGGL